MKSRILIPAACLAFMSGLTPLAANPTGGTVVAGQAQIGNGANGTLTITQGSNHAIINWGDFSINAGETTRFAQPNSASAVLNRVTGGNPSALLGKLEGNGSIYLINPNGVLVGPNGIIQTGGNFVASTRDLSNDAFLAGGAFNFKGDSAAGVENLGFIKSDAGDVILVGRTVKNAGTIEAQQGVAGLAAGDDVLLSATGTDRLSVRVSVDSASADTGVDNAGTVKAAQAQLTAAGGNVYALAINNGGLIEATGFSRGADGRVVLSAEGGAINVSGKIAAQDADGSGGTILVGGGYQGNDAAVPNARKTTVTDTASLNVDATTGDGGQVIVWADERTEFHGAITARGGATGGDGGFVEVSGKQDLLFKGTADTRAPAGTTGTLLLDPADITIDVTSQAPGTGANALSMSDLSLQLQNNNITISTSSRPGTEAGDITFIGAASGEFHFPNALTFNADRDIIFNAPLSIVATSGPESQTPIIQGAVTFNAGRDITINKELSFSAMSQGGVGEYSNGINTPAPGTSAPDITFGAITFNAGRGLTIQAGGNVILWAESQGGDAGGLNELSNTPSASGGHGGAITMGDLTLHAEHQISLYGSLRIGARSIGGAGGDGSQETASLEDTVNAGNGGNGGDIMIGKLVVKAGEDVILGNEWQGATLGYSLNSQGGRGGLYRIATGYGLGGNGGAITAAGTTIKASGAPGPLDTHRFVIRKDSHIDSVVKSTGGSGGEALKRSTSVEIQAGTGGRGGNVALGTTVIEVETLDLRGEGIYMLSQTTPGTGGRSWNIDELGGIGGDAGTASIGDVNLTATEYVTWLTTGLITDAITDDPTPDDPFDRAASGSAADATAGKINLTAGEDILASAGTRIYSPTGVTLKAGGRLQLRDAGVSTPGALILVADNKYPANPGFGTGQLVASGTTVLQGGPGATKPEPGNLGTNLNTLVYLFGVSPPHIDTYSVILTSFVPWPNANNYIQSANRYYDTELQAGIDSVVPGLYYKNIIVRDPLTVTARSYDLTYGFSALPTFTSTYAGFVGNNTINDFTLPSYTTSAAVGANAGTYTLTPGGMTGPANYSFNYISGTITINKAQLTATAQPATFVYGGLLPTYAATVAGLANGDTQASVVTVAPAPTTTITSGSNAGTYTIAPNAALTTAGNTNYTLAQTNGTLTITPATLNVGVGNASGTYGAPLPTVFTTTATGLRNSDVQTGVVSFAPTVAGATATSNVGTYTINPNATLLSSNYQIGTAATGTFTINRATLNVQANDASMTYGAGALPALSGTALNLVAGNTQVNVVSFAPTVLGATASSNVGTYAINPNATLLGATPNYTLGTQATGTLTISPATLNVAANNANKVYGAALPTFGGTALNLVNGDAQSAVVSFAPTTTANAGSNVGTYTISPNATLFTSNYVLGSATDGTLTITQAPLIITADNLSRLYGFANPALTATFNGLVNGETSSVVTGLNLGTTATPASAAGSYPIINNGTLASSNYAITFNSGSLIVGSPSSLTITADDFFLNYGFTALPSFTATALGLVGGDDASVITGLQFSTTAAVGANVGNYTIVPSSANAPANYIISYANGTLRVDPAVLNVAANNASKLYGAALPGLGGTALNLVNGDAQSSVVSFAPTTTATAGSNVGNYTITPHATLLSTNYTLGTQSPGTLTINPAVLNITANDASKTYGAALPLFTGAVGGLVNGDLANSVVALGFGTSATAGSNVGNYAITPTASLLGLTPNYTIGALTNGTLTVNRAPLTITADSFSRALGAANPALTATYAGLVNGDTSAVVSGLSLSTTAVPSSQAGNYVITAAGATSGNYTFSYVPGTLIVRGLNGLTLTAADAARTYGDPNPAFALRSIDGLLNGDSLTSVQFRTDATIGSNAGRYEITPYGAVVATAVPREYLISYLPGMLTINPAVLTVSLNSAMLHRSANGWQPIGGLDAVTSTDDSLTATSRYLVNGGGSDSFNYTISGFKNTADIASVDHTNAPSVSYGRVSITRQVALNLSNGVTTYQNQVLTYGPGPVMSQGGLKLTGAAAGNYTFNFPGYSPEVFNYVPARELTLAGLGASAYPDSQLILPRIAIYLSSMIGENATSRAQMLAHNGELTLSSTNYYNQALAAGLNPSYETNWVPGSPVGTYWALPKMNGLDSGIVNPIPGHLYDVSTPFYMPDLANPDSEFVIARVYVGAVNVFERGQEPHENINTILQTKVDNKITAQLINVGPIGAFGVPIGAQDVLYRMIDRMLTEANIDVGPNRVQGVAQWILANGNNPETRNALTAYMAQEAINIVTRGGSRSAGEQVFLDSLTNRVNENRAAAANEAIAAYNQWKTDQAAFRANISGYGALLNFGDRIPVEILALAKAEVPSAQILKVSGAVTGAMAGSGGTAIALILQSKEIMAQIMPFAARAVANGAAGGVAIAGGVAGAAPILNVVATLATIGMAAERLISADKDLAAFNQAIEALKKPTSIDSVLGKGTTNNLALMAAITATINGGSLGSNPDSSLGNRQ